MFRRLFFICALAMAAQATAQSVDPDRLDDLARQAEIEKSREVELGKSKDAVRQEIQSLRNDLVRAAAEAKKFEETGREIERKLSDLEIQQARLKTNIYQDRKTLMKLLGALQRVEANPPPALAVSPEDAADAVRAAKLMSAMSNDLKTRADALTLELEKLADVQVDIEKQQVSLKSNEVALEAKRGRIKSLVGQKANLEKSISSDQAQAQRRVAALAAEADSLRDLISRFESSTRDVIPRLKPDIDSVTRPTGPSGTKPKTVRPADPVTLPPGTVRFAAAKGRLRAPVQGRLTQGYTSAGKGLTVATRPKAQVVSPYAGRVEFAGPFKNYENVVILNMGDGYFILLTGLGEVYAKAEDVVSSGEPLGLMPFNTQSQKDLYIEIRKDGAAINPSPWLGTAFAG